VASESLLIQLAELLTAGTTRRRSAVRSCVERIVEADRDRVEPALPGAAVVLSLVASPATVLLPSARSTSTGSSVADRPDRR
jgi:hypothetical protein